MTSIDRVCILWLLFLCFFKQKTAYEMRISDWSSDVCSSDLHWPGTGVAALPYAGASVRAGLIRAARVARPDPTVLAGAAEAASSSPGQLSSETLAPPAAPATAPPLTDLQPCAPPAQPFPLLPPSDRLKTFPAPPPPISLPIHALGRSRRQSDMPLVRGVT